MPIFRKDPEWDEEELIVGCQCHWAEHEVRLLYFGSEPDECYVTFNLEPYENVLKRLWLALRYVFGYRSRFGEYGEIIIGPKDAVAIQTFLARFLAKEEKHG